MPTIVKRNPARRVRPATNWPYPPGVGSEIGREFRRFHLPKDDYYYLSFPYNNSVEETPATVARIASLGLPFEISKSPAGCVCYRIHRKHADLPEIARPPGPRDTCPVVLPAVQNKREIEWRMQQQNGFPSLFTNWSPIVRTGRRVRRRT